MRRLYEKEFFFPLFEKGNTVVLDQISKDQKMKFVWILDASCNECLYSLILVKDFLDTLFEKNVLIMIILENSNPNSSEEDLADSVSWYVYEDYEHKVRQLNDLPFSRQLNCFLLARVSGLSNYEGIICS